MVSGPPYCHPEEQVTLSHWYLEHVPLEVQDSTPLLLTLESEPELLPLAPKDPNSETLLSLVYTRGSGPAVRHLCWLPDSSDSDVEEVTMEDIPVISRPPKTHLANRRRGWLASPGPGNLGKGTKIWPLVHMTGCHP